MTEPQTPQVESAPQETEAVFPQKMTLKDRLVGALVHPKAPYVFGAAVLLAVGVGAYVHKGASMLPFAKPDVVLFDPVRFTNAQRAAASILAVSPNADVALSLTQVAKQAEVVIQEEAHGAVVLVKQAVVAPNGIPDITDAVLERFGLPKDVPTITTRVDTETLEGLAPTDNAFSEGKLREDYRLELEAKRSRIAAEQAKQVGQSNILP